LEKQWVFYRKNLKGKIEIKSKKTLENSRISRKKHQENITNQKRSRKTLNFKELKRVKIKPYL
jgi:hypothetical protein